MQSIDASPDHLRLIRKLSLFGDLGADDRNALAGLPLHVREWPEDADVIREGESASECWLVLDGLLCRYRLLSGGARQILSFHPTGDVVDLQGLFLQAKDHSVCALTPSRLAAIPHAPLLDLLENRPGVARAFWRDVLIDAAITRSWLAGVGRRNARQRLAHLICELFVRMRALDMSSDDGFDLVATQPELGDCLGLSAVHVNRVFQELRRDGLVASQGRFVRILDWEGLQRAADFDATYLHLAHGAP